MKTYNLRRVGVLKLSVIGGIIYAILGLLLAPFVLVSVFFGEGASGAMLGIMLIILPIFYGILGFVTTALMAGLFNVIAPRVGGVELGIDTDTAPAADF